MDAAPITQNPRPSLPPLPAMDLSTAPLAHVKTPQSASSPTTPGLPVSRFGHTSLSAAFRFVEPTWRNYIMYVDMEARTGNADAARYLKLWHDLPARERLAHMPEQLCDLANVNAPDLIGWVAKQSFAEGSARANMCLSFMRDKVLETTARYAMESPDNYKHAELFLKAAGSLPTPQGRGGGISIPIFNMPTASSGSVAGVVSESSPVDRSGLRDMDAEISELSKIMQTGVGVTVTVDQSAHDRDDDDEDDDDDEGDEDDD